MSSELVLSLGYMVLVEGLFGIGNAFTLTYLMFKPTSAIPNAEAI